MGTKPAITETPKPATRKVAKDVLETVVYVGPTKSGLTTGTILKSLNETAKKIMAADKLFRLMFPRPADVGRVRREIKDGGLLRDVYNKLKEVQI